MIPSKYGYYRCFLLRSCTEPVEKIIYKTHEKNKKLGARGVVEATKSTITGLQIYAFLPFENNFTLA